MTALRIGDDPLTPAAVVAASRGGAIDVELSAGGARAHRGVARAPPRSWRSAARVYGRTTGVGANRHVAVAGGTTCARTACGCCAAIPAA